MNPRLVLGASGVALIAAVVFCAHAYRAAQAAESRWSEAQGRRSAAQAEYQRRVEEAARARRAAAVARTVSSGSLRSEASDAPAGGMSSAAQRTDAPARAVLRKQYLDAYRLSLDTAFRLLFNRLHLSPDQASGLKALLVQREANNLAVDDAAAAKGVDESDPEIVAMDDQLSDANKAAMRDLIGYPNERVVHQFLLQTAVLPYVDSFASVEASTGTPLTEDQEQAVLGALADASQKKDSGRVLKDTVNWTQAETALQTTLSPQQQAGFLLIRQMAEGRAQVNDQVAQINGLAPKP